MALIRVRGELLGERRADGANHASPQRVLRITEEQRPGGPAAKSFIVTETDPRGGVRGRYLSWIGYADIDRASDLEFGRWRVIDPPVVCDVGIDWLPFGWGSADRVWGHTGSLATAGVLPTAGDRQR